MFRSLDHLQAEIYLLGFTRLTTEKILENIFLPEDGRITETCSGLSNINRKKL
jgi:hypothetical protein